MDYVVVNAAGCGSSLKEYGELLRDDPAYAERAAAFAAKVRDLSELLVELGPVAPRHPLPVTVAYHDACHLGARPGRPGPAAGAAARHPRPEAARDRRAGDLLRLGRHLERAEPGAGRRARRPQGRRNVLATGAELLVTANPGCLMQVAAALRRAGRREIALAHTVEVLDASLRGLPVAALRT